MERKFYTDDFEQLLKEQSDEFRMYPSKRVWHSIYNDLHPGRKWPSVAVCMFLIIALLMTGYWNSNSNDAAIAKIEPVSPAIQNTLKNNTEIAALTEIDKNNNSSTLVYSAASPQNNTVVNSNIKRQVAVVKPHAKQLFNGTGTIGKRNLKGNKLNNGTGLIPEQAIDEIAIITEEAKTTMIITAPVIEKELVTTEIFNAEINNDNVVANVADQNKNTSLTSASIPKTAAPVSKVKTMLVTEDKAWVEDYAFHNKSKRKPWRDRTTLDLYITPNITYRKLNNDSKYNMPASANSFASLAPGADAKSSVDHTPGLGLEAGLGITYSVGKNFRIKAGIQANYTNYGVNADETNHPVVTTLMLLDPNSGYPYMSSSSSTLANSSGLQPVKMHNKTYQFSLPLGIAYKIMGNDKLEFYAGAALQPTFVLGGKANLISADRKNYVADPSMISKWNLNTGVETYINYKLDGFTLQAGPQFRYQLLSTYNKNYTVTENLYSMGIKVGILKNF